MLVLFPLVMCLSIVTCQKRGEPPNCLGMKHQFPKNTQAPQQWMLSDARRLPDWPNRLAELPRHIGFILRDYQHAARADLARDMAALCRAQNRQFAIAGNRRLARRFGARFHCPSHLLARPAARLGAAAAGDMAAVHNERELRLALAAGFDTVLVSPVFATASHADARTLGVMRALPLLRAARHAGLRAYALGGLNARAYQRLGGRAHADGWAAIAAFARTG
jgi:thiamine-phosphate pyrophosphorylase